MSTWMMVRGGPMLDTPAGGARRGGSAEPETGGHGRERLHHEPDVLIEVDTEFDGAAVDVVAVDGSREGLVLQLLLPRRGFKSGNGLARTHERACGHEARQLLTSERAATRDGTRQTPK